MTRDAYGPTGDARAERLERGYRRLLASYPARYRAIYGEEMIGVLMTASTPDQRRPDTREALSLITAGLRARLRMTSWTTRSAAWRPAAGAFGYLASVTLAALFLRYLIPGVYSPVTPSRGALVLAGSWTLVAVVAGIGLRAVAAIGASLGAFGLAVLLARTYGNDPGQVVTRWWQLVLAVTAAAALVTLVRTPAGERPPRFLSVRARVMVALAAVAACAAPALDYVSAAFAPDSPRIWREGIQAPWFNVPPIGHRAMFDLTMLLLAVTLAVVVVRQPPSVRRRIVLLAVPAPATALMVMLTFGGFLVSSPRFFPPVYLVAPQWITLVATPLLVFAVGARLVARYERKLASGDLLA
jgi:hypothetical protein